MTRAALLRSARAAASPAVSREAREKSENLFDSIKANLSPSRDKFSRIKSWNMIRFVPQLPLLSFLSPSLFLSFRCILAYLILLDYDRAKM